MRRLIMSRLIRIYAVYHRLLLWKSSNILNQSTERTGGSIISECRRGIWSWTGTLVCFIRPYTSCSLRKQCRPWLDTTFCGIWSVSALFAKVSDQVLQILLFARPIDVTVPRMTQLLITVTWISYKRAAWFHWSVITTGQQPKGKFGLTLCIL